MRIGLMAGILAAGAGFVAWDILRQRSWLDLRGKVVLITGGSRGLGLQMAREFGGHGAVIAICARDSEELARAQADLNSCGIEVYTFVCDVSDHSQVDAMVAQANRKTGGIDVLVNNAGVIRVGPFSAMGMEDFKEAMDVMFWGALHTTLAVLPSMRERGRGSIVNITSIGGKVSVPHLLPYSCAKFATVALSEGLRAELAPENIRVTTIVPGLIRTGSHLNATFKGRQSDEYAWFAAGAATPVVSIAASRAARSIVQATIRGANEKILSVPAALFAHLNNEFPGLGVSVLELVNRMLPSNGGSEPNRIVKGREVENQIKSSLWKSLTRPGQSAAESLNELPA